MSAACPSLTALRDIPEGWAFVAHYNACYMAGDWSGYGYAGIVAVAPGAEFTGQFRSIRGRQAVVEHTGKYFFGAQSERAEGMKAFRRCEQQAAELNAARSQEAAQSCAAPYPPSPLLTAAAPCCTQARLGWSFSRPWQPPGTTSRACGPTPRRPAGYTGGPSTWARRRPLGAAPGADRCGCRTAAAGCGRGRLHMIEAINLVFGTGLIIPIAWAAWKIGDELTVWIEHWARRGRL